jgi:hypothetical protein
MATVGLAQCHQGQRELPIVTCGNDVANIWRFLPDKNAVSYSAKDVIDHLLASPVEHEQSTAVQVG